MDSHGVNFRVSAYGSRTIIHAWKFWNGRLPVAKSCRVQGPSMAMGLGGQLLFIEICLCHLPPSSKTSSDVIMLKQWVSWMRCWIYEEKESNTYWQACPLGWWKMHINKIFEMMKTNSNHHVQFLLLITIRCRDDIWAQNCIHWGKIKIKIKG